MSFFVRPTVSNASRTTGMRISTSFRSRSPKMFDCAKATTATSRIDRPEVGDRLRRRSPLLLRLPDGFDAHPDVYLVVGDLLDQVVEADVGSVQLDGRRHVRT